MICHGEENVGWYLPELRALARQLKKTTSNATEVKWLQYSEEDNSKKHNWTNSRNYKIVLVFCQDNSFPHWEDFA